MERKNLNVRGLTSPTLNSFRENRKYRHATRLQTTNDQLQGAFEKEVLQYDASYKEIGYYAVAFLFFIVMGIGLIFMAGLFYGG